MAKAARVIGETLLNRGRFDLTKTKIEVAEIADTVIGAQERYDLGVQEAADLPVGRGDTAAVIAALCPQHAAKRAAFGQDERRAKDRGGRTPDT